MMATGGAADELAAAEGLLQESDGAAIDVLVDRVFASHTTQVAQYRAGKTAVAGYLVGQVMKGERRTRQPLRGRPPRPRAAGVAGRLIRRRPPGRRRTCMLYSRWSSRVPGRAPIDASPGCRD